MTREAVSPVPGDARDERGAVLILALLSMVVVGLIVLTLSSFTGFGLRLASVNRVTRATQYAVSGAANMAVQRVRFSFLTFASTPGAGSQAPAACSQGPSNVITIGSTSSVVYCTGTYDYYSPTGATRKVNFYVCPSTEGLNACTTTASGPLAPELTATVVFDDWTALDQNSCNGSSTTTCGTGMTVQNWLLKSA